ncbi:hypothetical protein PENTCL1PPCAC_2014, partial [Pristionchus entomophagus]
EEDRCMEDYDPGPCQHYQIRWFWDPADETCKEFHYGGCMGTRNRFATKQECMKQCRYKLHNPAVIPGDCKKLFFHGCGGNGNKFYSLHLCNKVCAEKLSPKTACNFCDLRTSYCKAHGKFNYTCECRLGFQKDSQSKECIDIDECRESTNNCDRNAWCTNTIGSYSCECMASYVGDGKQCTYVGLGWS